MMELADFAAHLLTIEDDLADAAERACERACRLVARRARGMIGHEQPFWPALAESTIEDKRRQGYRVPAPLLRTGELKDSIWYDGPHREGDEVYGDVGSTSPPMRNLARIRHQPDSAEAVLSAAIGGGRARDTGIIADAELLRAFLGGGSNFGEAMMGLRALKKIWDDMADLTP